MFNGVIKRWLPPLVWVYFTLLFGWATVYWLTGDRNGHLALVNALAVYLFIPLPIVLLANLFLRRREIWIALAVRSGLFLYFWGGLFLPRLERPPERTSALKVMTYNTLGHHEHTEAALDVLRAELADVVFLQEVNHALAAVLHEEFWEDYPYQILDPQESVRGMGIISRFPIRFSGQSLPLDWVGAPQVLEMEWEGETVTLVNFHMWSTNVAPREIVEFNFRGRETQAAALADLARGVDGPLIVAGDGNATSLSTAYKIMAAELSDAWQEAGWGFGHTFPGSAIDGSAWPRIGNWFVPQWLVRIDYVFHSEHWATDAHLAPFDGGSDHRGVIATLVLPEE